ncbi:MAG: hypothetical protein N3A59_05230 [Thermodesulfovibrionales bacterium]|nr:hypothetical protein [Thermodesulfovibrionales bacterium]
MRIGTISEFLNLKIIIIFILQFLIIVGSLGYKTWKERGDECIKCHSDMEKITKLGYPQFYVTDDMIKKETKHLNIKCQDCHLGNPRAKEPAKAHEGMLSIILVSEEGEKLKRIETYPYKLIPSGEDKIRNMLPQVEYDGKLHPHPQVRNVLWHDRDPITFNYDPTITKKTCGRSGCHPSEMKQFHTTIMATNLRQRTMKTWLDPYGPQN